MKAGDEPVVVEQTFNVSVEAAWNAITDIDQMRQWYFDTIPSFEPEAGFETQFNVHSQGRDFLHLWRVTDVVPLRMIRYNWRRIFPSLRERPALRAGRISSKTG